MFFQMTEVR